MLAAIADARQSIRLEMYIVHAGATAGQFREALIEARRRGVRVRVLVDAVGSMVLPESFWAPLRGGGGEFRWFNPLSLSGWSIRDHRKLLVCDESLAFVGGVNIAPEYQGDGVTAGWRDLGLAVRGPLAGELAAAFDEMFACADFRHPPFARLRKSPRQKIVAAPAAQIAPGRAEPQQPDQAGVAARSPQGALGADHLRLFPAAVENPALELVRAARTRRAGAIDSAGQIGPALLAAGGAKFLPAVAHWREWRFTNISRKSCTPKCFLLDDVVYAGSANLDPRSSNINYELMVRLSHPDLARRGAEIFERDLAHCRRIEVESWRKARTLMDRSDRGWHILFWRAWTRWWPHGNGVGRARRRNDTTRSNARPSDEALLCQGHPR